MTIEKKRSERRNKGSKKQQNFSVKARKRKEETLKIFLFSFFFLMELARILNKQEELHSENIFADMFFVVALFLRAIIVMQPE